MKVKAIQCSSSRRTAPNANEGRERAKPPPPAAENAEG
jgi:hypothetical protein